MVGCVTIRRASHVLQGTDFVSELVARVCLFRFAKCVYLVLGVCLVLSMLSVCVRA